MMDFVSLTSPAKFERGAKTVITTFLAPRRGHNLKFQHEASTRSGEREKATYNMNVEKKSENRNKIGKPKKMKNCENVEKLCLAQFATIWRSRNTNKSACACTYRKVHSICCVRKCRTMLKHYVYTWYINA